MWRNLTVLSALSALLLSSATPAASYPDRPIRWVLGFAPAGAPDVVARIVSPQLSAQLGQSVVLDNRPGANGILAADLVARANSDGYTLLITPAAFVINPSIQKKLPFDPIASFEPVTNLCVSEALRRAGQARGDTGGMMVARVKEIFEEFHMIGRPAREELPACK